MNTFAPFLTGLQNRFGSDPVISTADARPHSRLAGLAAVVLGLSLAGTSLNAAVVFDVAEMTASPGTLVSVPVTTSGFTDINTFQFTLTWDPSVITFDSTSNYGIPGLGAGNFGFLEGRPDRLTVSWDDQGSPTTRTDGSTLFSVVFTTVGQPSESSSITFSDDPTEREVTAGVGAQEGTIMTFEGVPGMVTVVPEPINVALGIFGGLVAVTAGYRKFRGKVPQAK